MSKLGAAPLTFSELWSRLEIGLEMIFSESVGITMKDWMTLYDSVHSFCTRAGRVAPTASGSSSSRPGTASRGSGGAGGARTPAPGAQLLGGDIYARFEEFLRQRAVGVCNAARSLRDEAVLEYYAAQWLRFSRATQRADRILAYINRFWVKREMDEGRADVFPISTLCLFTWRQFVFRPLEEILVSNLLSLIARDRDGEPIPADLAQHLIASLIALDHARPTAGSLQLYGLYNESFLKPFLAATEMYYYHETRKFLGENSLHDYLLKVRARFLEEKQRLRVYLHEPAEPSLLAVLTKTLIVDHQERLLQDLPLTLARFEEFADAHHQIDPPPSPPSSSAPSPSITLSTSSPCSSSSSSSGMGALFSFPVRFPADASLLDAIGFDQEQALQSTAAGCIHLFYLLQQRLSDEGLFPMRDILERHITQVGQKALRAVESDAIKDPVLFVNVCTVIIDRYLNVSRHLLAGDHAFLSSLDKAFRTFLNRNSIADKHPKTSMIAELLAQYADAALKKPSKLNPDEIQRERMLDRLIDLFNYLEPKDAFMTFYAKTLARRLIGGLSSGEHMENSLIGKLKQQCGYEHTSRLSRMVDDVAISGSLTKTFSDEASPSPTAPVECSFLIIARGIWPIKEHLSRCDMRFPAFLEEARTRFERFYTSKHSGRKLTWLHAISKGEVRCHITDRKYIFQCSALQMIILAFMGQAGQKTIVTFQAIHESTQIPEDQLAPVLKTLLRTRLVLCQPALASPISDFAADSLFKLNHRFQNNRINVNININLPKPKDNEADSETQRQIEEGRKLEIQACIVRIMKMRKVYDHRSLVQDVFQQLSRRFDPGVNRIKRCIDILIDKDFLERVAGTTDQYKYIS